MHMVLKEFNIKKAYFLPHTIFKLIALIREHFTPP